MMKEEKRNELPFLYKQNISQFVRGIQKLTSSKDNKQQKRQSRKEEEEYQNFASLLHSSMQEEKEYKR